MAQRKKAAAGAGAEVGPPLRPGDADVPGGSDAAGLGAELAVQILVKDLQRLNGLGHLDAESGALVALYARTLSAIENARARRGKGGDLGTKSIDELLEMAMEDPMLRDALARRQA